jgi:arylsulfatase A-like enzyme
VIVLPSGPMVLFPHVYKKLDYDAVTDFTPDLAAHPQHDLHRRRRPGLRRPGLLRRPRRRSVPVSPVLDALAAGGLRFTQGYANSPVCSPTRFALMTMRYQYRLRGAPRSPSTAERGSATLGLPPEHPTLPSLLRDAGYRTALIGKWHLGYPPHFGPLRSGYDEFFGPMAAASTTSPMPIRPATTTCTIGAAEQPTDGYLTDLITQRAVDWVQRAADAAGALLPEPALHRAALALGDARRRELAPEVAEPVPPGRRQHPHLPAHDPPHGRGHRPAAAGAAPRPGSTTR